MNTAIFNPFRQPGESNRAAIRRLDAEGSTRGDICIMLGLCRSTVDHHLPRRPQPEVRNPKAPKWARAGSEENLTPTETDRAVYSCERAILKNGARIMVSHGLGVPHARARLDKLIGDRPLRRRWTDWGLKHIAGMERI